MPTTPAWPAKYSLAHGIIIDAVLPSPRKVGQAALASERVTAIWDYDATDSKPPAAIALGAVRIVYLSRKPMELIRRKRKQLLASDWH